MRITNNWGELRSGCKPDYASHGGYEQAITMPILRPLVGMDKEEIVQIAREIGTLETSNLPYEDCCTVFTPRRPKTKPRINNVVEVEKAVPFEELEAEAIEETERTVIGK